jgi:hypothetical protein
MNSKAKSAVVSHSTNSERERQTRASWCGSSHCSARFSFCSKLGLAFAGGLGNFDLVILVAWALFSEGERPRCVWGYVVVAFAFIVAVAAAPRGARANSPAMARSSNVSTDSSVKYFFEKTLLPSRSPSFSSFHKVVGLRSSRVRTLRELRRSGPRVLREGEFMIMPERGCGLGGAECVQRLRPV